MGGNMARKRAVQKRVGLRAALAMFDLSGRTTAKVFREYRPRPSSSNSDWAAVGKDFQKAVIRANRAPLTRV